MTDDTALDLVGLSVGLAGGLAIFLYGLEKLTTGLKILAGDRMRDLLAKMTTNRFKAVTAGALITATIQSSSVTTVLVVGFISAGLMSLSQSIGVIMGAEIGTTITAQIIAFKVTKYALVLVAAGFLMLFTSKKERTRQLGHMLLGLGLVFFGMQLMKQAMSPLQDYEPFANTMKSLDNPLLAVLFSALFTGLIQSSSATTGVIIALASEGFLSLEAGIPLIFGANIGTCVTAFLASIGKPREAVRAAMVHILFNTAGVLLWIGFIPYLAEFIRWLSPAAEGLGGVEQLQADTPRQIANAHTIFNVTNTLIFIGFTPLIARIVERIIPDRKIEDSKATDRRYLENLLVHTPVLALDVVRMELARLGDTALGMVKAAREPLFSGTAVQLADLRKMDEEVDDLHAAMVAYLGRLSRENLSGAQSDRLSEYIAAANYLENIGDMIETDLVDAGLARVEANLTISESTQQVFKELYDKVEWTVERAVEALASNDRSMAQEICDAKNEITGLADGLDAHLAARLTSDEPHRLENFRLETELVEVLRRIYYFAKRIAKGVVEHARDEDSDDEAAGDTDSPSDDAAE